MRVCIFPCVCLAFSFFDTMLQTLIFLPPFFHLFCPVCLAISFLIPGCLFLFVCFFVDHHCYRMLLSVEEPLVLFV